jgi:ABC-2 type transport system permease protein
VLPRIYSFSTLGHLPQIFALATVFLLATSFMGQAIGAWFTRPENATILILATSLPQFFNTGFAWPREAIPDTAIALGTDFSRRLRDRWPRARQPAGCRHLGGRA